MKIKNLYAITITIFGILSAGCATETRIDPIQPIDVGDMTFLAPAGEGWEYNRDDSGGIDTALFIRGGHGAPAFGVMVWQMRVDDPVGNRDDLWDGFVQPYRDVWDAEVGNELSKTECDPDQTLTTIGMLCQVEGRATSAGRLSFWA